MQAYSCSPQVSKPTGPLDFLGVYKNTARVPKSYCNPWYPHRKGKDYIVCNWLDVVDSKPYAVGDILSIEDHGFNAPPKEYKVLCLGKALVYYDGPMYVTIGIKYEDSFTEDDIVASIVKSARGPFDFWFDCHDFQTRATIVGKRELSGGFMSEVEQYSSSKLLFGSLASDLAHRVITESLQFPVRTTGTMAPVVIDGVTINVIWNEGGYSEEPSNIEYTEPRDLSALQALRDLKDFLHCVIQSDLFDSLQGNGVSYYGADYDNSAVLKVDEVNQTETLMLFKGPLRVSTTVIGEDGWPGTDCVLKDLTTPDFVCEFGADDSIKAGGKLTLYGAYTELLGSSITFMCDCNYLDLRKVLQGGTIPNALKGRISLEKRKGWDLGTVAQCRTYAYEFSKCDYLYAGPMVYVDRDGIIVRDLLLPIKPESEDALLWFKESPSMMLRTATEVISATKKSKKVKVPEQLLDDLAKYSAYNTLIGTDAENFVKMLNQAGESSTNSKSSLAETMAKFSG